MMKNKGKIFSRRCWVDGTLQPATVSFSNGLITSVSLYREDDADDCGDDILMPGVIDAHVHVNEPGRTEWEGFETATSAAAAGGITSLVDMPLNSSPVTTSKQAFDAKTAAGSGKIHVNVGLYGGLVPGNAESMGELCDAGVLGVKCFLVHSGIDEFPNAGGPDIDAAMPILTRYNRPLLVHAEIDGSGAPDDLNSQPASYAAYLRSRPDKWETDAIAYMIDFCRKHRCPLHIVHVSSALSLPLIEAAKKEGLPLTAETCPHYLLFCAEEIPDAKTIYKCAPPIRSRANNQQLKEALRSGILDFVGSDHSPAPPDIKELESGNLKKAWGGIAGLQFLLQASWTALQDTMNLETFIPLVTEHPASFLRVSNRKGFLKPGFDADLVIWSPGEKFIVRPELVLHRHKDGPYNGRELFGVVKKTIVNGSTAFDNQLTDIKAGAWLLQK